MRLIQNITIVCALLYAAPAYAQTLPADSIPCREEIDLTSSMLSDSRRALWRALNLTTLPRESGIFRSSSLGQKACIQDYTFLGPWRPGSRSGRLDLLPVQVSSVSNSAYPRSVNDGAAWQGVGFTLGITAGARARWRFLEAQLAPEAYYQQNQDFEVNRHLDPGMSEFASPYRSNIDLPTRFGAESFETVHLGQSYVKAGYRNFAITLSTENVWLGTAEVYPILHSYTAPGFPHVRVGTQKPIDLKVADLELQLIMASLQESEYFNGDSDDDEHYYTVAVATVQPHFIPGLYLGVARALHDSASAFGHGVGFYVDRVIERSIFGNRSSGNRAEGNAIGALLGRWVLPESGFEIYAEWSREDTPADFADVLREPDWTQAYVFGFQKAFARSDRLIRLYGELNHLGESAPARAGRGFFSYYTHRVIRQGHTHQGQLLGAAIGPGSDAQLLGVDIFSASGRSAFRIERARYDDDTYYRRFARRWGETRHDAEITLSASRTHFLRGIELEAGLQFSRRYGRDFIGLDSEAADRVENNFSSRLGASWRPSF